MGIIDKNNAEFERQKTLLLRSIARAKLLIHPMETIGEDEKNRIQDFIAYSIPRCSQLFNERQQFRSVLKGLSNERVKKDQAMKEIEEIKCRLEKKDTVLYGAQ